MELVCIWIQISSTVLVLKNGLRNLGYSKFVCVSWKKIIQYIFQRHV